MEGWTGHQVRRGIKIILHGGATMLETSEQSLAAAAGSSGEAAGGGGVAGGREHSSVKPLVQCNRVANLRNSFYCKLFSDNQTFFTFFYYG